jgi:hypothetical protein
VAHSGYVQLIINSLTANSPQLVLPRVIPNDVWTQADPSHRRVSAPADIASSPCVASQERPGKRRRTAEDDDAEQAGSSRVRYFISQTLLMLTIKSIEPPRTLA